MSPSMPPVPPQIANQQQPPPAIRQFAQGGGQQDDPNALASNLIDSIAKQYTQLAQVISQTKPELVPILKQSVQALAMLAGKLKTQQQGAPQGGDQGTGGQGAPDAGGGAAMGMPQ